MHPRRACAARCPRVRRSAAGLKPRAAPRVPLPLTPGVLEAAAATTSEGPLALAPTPEPRSVELAEPGAARGPRRVVVRVTRAVAEATPARGVRVAERANAATIPSARLGSAMAAGAAPPIAAMA